MKKLRHQGRVDRDIIAVATGASDKEPQMAKFLLAPFLVIVAALLACTEAAPTLTPAETPTPRSSATPPALQAKPPVPEDTEATPRSTPETKPLPEAEPETSAITEYPANPNRITGTGEAQEQTPIPASTHTPVHVPAPTLSPEERQALQLANEKIRLWAVEKVRPAVVFLGDTSWRASTGFIYRTEGETAYILTDAESVRFMDRTPVITYNGTRLIGDIRSKWNSPLAVVQVCCAEFHSIEFSDEETPQAGDELTTLGYTGSPDESADQYTTTVTGTRVQDGDHLHRNYRILRTDHRPNHVQAGSPLFDHHGRVAGILAQLGAPGDVISTDSIREALPFLEGLEPRWKPAPTARWSAGEMRRRLMHLQVTIEGRDHKIGNGFVYKTEGRSAYIAASYTTASLLAAEDLGKLQVVTYDGLRMAGDLFWDGEPVALIRTCCADFEPLEFSVDDTLDPDDRLIGLGYATGQDSPFSYAEATVTTVLAEDGYSLAILDTPLSHIEFPSFGQPLSDEEGTVAGILTSKEEWGEELVVPAGPMREMLSRLELMALDWTPDTVVPTAPTQDWYPAEIPKWSADQVRPGIVHIGEALYKIGTGFVYRTEGETAYIVTYSERVGYRDRVPVITHHGRRMEADILWEPDAALAVLRVCCGDFEPLELSEDGTLEVGDPITALGHPLGPENPMSYIRANIREKAVNYDGHHIADADRPLSPPKAYWGGTWMGAPAFNDQGHVAGIVIGHRDDHDTVMSADSAREILSHLETLQPNWQPSRIDAINPYEHGYWHTWPELQAEDDNKTEPFVQIKGTGPGQDRFRYWFQARCDVPVRRIVAALIEFPLQDQDFIPSERPTWTPVELVIDGNGLETERWMKWGPESYQGTMHYVPDETTGLLMDTLSQGAHLLEIIKNPDTGTPEYHRFVVVGSENVIGPVVEACR